ncbi:F-box only protein 21-like [Nylanderia fulva]|uniref:F-box only protein 21-like n=1 Tax=Nylanderia fulva TaxID=613905 RepID=UPI0010FB551C|nr:F-box only protein 21-like [Nylanderia fulva]
MITIEDLSNEIILSILENETISLRDVENFSSTCKRFEWMSHYKTLWKKKYAQKWPTAQIFCKDTMGIEFNDLNIEDFKESMKCAENFWLDLPRMSHLNYYHRLLEEDIKKSFYMHAEKHPLNLLILSDELTRNIYQQNPRQCNLTETYYSIRIFRYLYEDIHFLHKKKIVEKYNHMERLEDLIVLILQYCHPNTGITMLYIDKFIDNIVQEVLKLLKDEYLQHPILSMPPEQLSIWRNNHINKNFWCEKDAMSIKDTKEDTLYYKQTLWLAIYICVANKLGLHVITTKHDIDDNYTRHTHLLWQSRNCTENTECFTFEWTDNSDNAKISNIRKCQRVSPQDEYRETRIPSISVERTIRDIYDLWKYGRFSFDNINYGVTSIDLYNEEICTPDETFRKKRSPNLKYAIGLIVTHKHKMEDNTQKDVAGVIIGWHNECHIERFVHKETYCILNDIERECIPKNNIDNWKSQPHYVLLIENDLCYVPQCAITSVCKEWINNSETGKYFCKFEDTHYVPNNMLEQDYPDDAAVVRDILLRNRKL